MLMPYEIVTSGTNPRTYAQFFTILYSKIKISLQSKLYYDAQTQIVLGYIKKTVIIRE